MLEIEGSVALFSLVLMRMAGCILFNPILGRTTIPMAVKSAFILVLSVVVYSISPPVMVDMGNVIGYGVLLLKEFAVGMILGTVFNFMISGILFAGAVMDYQMGLSMSTIYDAQSNASVSLTANVLNYLFALCFLATDAHLIVLRIFMTSAQIVPYGSVSLGPEVASAALTFFCDFILLMFRLAMPMLAVQLFVEAGVGILMKTIPQINIFVVNIQAKILVGLVILVLLFIPMSDFMLDALDILIQSMKEMLIVMRG